MSGLPYEGAAEGNQYTPDAQRLNCQKVRLHPAQREGPILCLLSKNSELKSKASCTAAQLIRNTQCLGKSRKGLGRNTGEMCGGLTAVLLAGKRY